MEANQRVYGFPFSFDQENGLSFGYTVLCNGSKLIMVVKLVVKPSFHTHRSTWYIYFLDHLHPLSTLSSLAYSVDYWRLLASSTIAITNWAFTDPYGAKAHLLFGIEISGLATIKPYVYQLFSTIKGSWAYPL